LPLQIVAVSDARQRISVSGIEQHSSEAAARWQATAGQIKNAFTTKMGIDIGPLPIMLDVRVCSGYKRGADGSVAKEYGKELVPYPLQVGCNQSLALIAIGRHMLPFLLPFLTLLAHRLCCCGGSQFGLLILRSPRAHACGRYQRFLPCLHNTHILLTAGCLAKPAQASQWLC
jgi:hypothetical protein